MSGPFYFQTIPLAEIASEGSCDPDPTASTVVLVVDDEHVIADTLTAILSRSGFTVMPAYDGASALQIARAISPGLLITDVFMPGMSGIDLAIAMRAAHRDCKVLLFSGQASTLDLLAKARNDGYDFALLLKPVHPTELLARISECIQIPAAELSVV